MTQGAILGPLLINPYYFKYIYYQTCIMAYVKCVCIEWIFINYPLHRPDLFRWSEVPANDHVETLNHAFDVAHKHLGIPRLLDAEGKSGIRSYFDLLLNGQAVGQQFFQFFFSVFLLLLSFLLNFVMKFMRSNKREWIKKSFCTGVFLK